MEHSAAEEGLSPLRRALDEQAGRLLDRSAGAIVDRWLLLANAALGAFALLPFLAPVFMELGWTRPASLIYWFYQLACHQLAERAHYLFGYQMAYCARDTAIYTAAFLIGLVYAARRGRVPRLDWRLYVLLSAPMALDGFSQLFGLRESTAALRTFTGSLFGAASVWLVFPYLDHYLAKARQSAPSPATDRAE